MRDLVDHPVLLMSGALLLLAAPFLAACTDDDGSGGGGGAAAQGGTAASGGYGGATAACDGSPQPTGQLEDDECMSSWSSQTQTCELECDDEANNAFIVRCSNGHCECVYNQQVICGCEADHNSTCQNHCCPVPWKQ